MLKREKGRNRTTIGLVGAVVGVQFDRGHAYKKSEHACPNRCPFVDDLAHLGSIKNATLVRDSCPLQPSQEGIVLLVPNHNDSWMDLNFSYH
ncbi:aspartyl protease-like protein [Corchorus olitorius]|uniref:Aspartyl protease-like protein n=1 Tax=Corchorus olitorius TaxID=93759 RepID=A0A1R3IAQ5_9ROSI|nr:aspartyl protease-like protein [Corchorus olitorius]